MPRPPADSQGADLANLVNEAALLAARADRKTVTQADLQEAIERVVAGLEKRSRVLAEDEKRIVAYHEVGHAIVGHLVPGGSKVAKISIVPRGMSALGYTLQLPTEDRFLNSKEDLQGQITTLLGGRSAEEIVFGEDHHRCGQRSATGHGHRRADGEHLRHEHVCWVHWPTTVRPVTASLARRANPRRAVSDATAQSIDREVRQLVDNAHNHALAILESNRESLEADLTEDPGKGSDRGRGVANSAEPMQDP